MPNRLAQATSPYLQQHADNPVDWMEWGEEAFAKARQEQKPIFLSIGYSTCHWCHVMAHESFEHPDIARLLNAEFVPIKVDREERPDVDRVYMTYVQALTGHGGWPLSAWLTPELKPFFGGTYFPPEDRQGRPGFPTILRAITRGWADEREKLVAESHRVIAALHAYGREESGGGAAGAAKADLTDEGGQAFEQCFQYLSENFDQQDGGFGGAPKFPRASNLDFLFRCAVLQGLTSEAAKEAVAMATTTLRRMSEGGIHDHVGGGFHRYSVDDTWFVPHFEKMLYDQAQIALNLVEAHQFTGDERYAWVTRGILEYVLRDLTHPDGGFFAAEDADSPVLTRPKDTLGEAPTAGAAEARVQKAEGAFYLWTKAELEQVLGADAAWFCDHYGVQEGGNVPAELDPHAEMRGGNILKQRRPLVETARAHRLDVGLLADALVRALERLRAVRALRPRPHRDEKIITAWNGLMISALARAAVSSAACLVEKREFYRTAAVRAAEFVQRELSEPGNGALRRAWRDGRTSKDAFAEDYAALIAGLLDLYEATWEVRWLRWAEDLQRAMDRQFWDAAAGGYYQSAADDASIVLRLKDDHDGAEPSANSLAANNLFRLAAIRHDEGFTQRGRQTIEALRRVWTRSPWAVPALLCAVERALEPARQVVIAGDRASREFAELVAEALGRPGRRRAVLARTGDEEEERWLVERAPALAEMRADGPATAYVCEGFTCRQPVTSPPELRRLLVTG
jgi:uncharacterized protein